MRKASGHGEVPVECSHLNGRAEVWEPVQVEEAFAKLRD